VISYRSDFLLSKLAFQIQPPPLRIGYTHDVDGRRLLTNRGQALPAGYDDPNVMPPREGASAAGEPPPPPP
jgi:hypothetical protein